MVKKILNSFLPKLIGFRLMTLFRIKPKKAVYKAFILFCTPRKGFVKPHQKDYLKAHQSKTIKFKKIQIQTYRWNGKGPKILLLHGWDSNTYRWKSLIKKLQQSEYDITAFDAPAHGYSEGNLLNVPIYNQLLKIVIEDTLPDFLVGHSMGAMTSVYNQYRHPNSTIQKMILLGSPSDMERIILGFKKILGLNNKFMKAVQDYFKFRYGYYFKDFNIASFAKDIKIKTLIIHDKYDKIIPYKEALEIHQSINSSKLIITEGAGHSLHQEKIEKQILQFLQA